MFITNLQAKATDVELPVPAKNGGLPFGEALALRRSIRKFDPDRTLSMQTISDLLWSACGISSPSDGKRTNPTALDKQDIDVYVFTARGIYLYEPAANRLKLVFEGDRRSLLEGTEEFSQDFVMDAPLTLLIVSDTARFGMPGDPRTQLMGAMDAGIVSENINLFCAANGLATVTRATMDGKAISQLLHLSPLQIPMLNNPVGYTR